MSEVSGGEGRPSGSPKQERNEEGEGLPGGRSERREAARPRGRDRAGRRRFSATERQELLEALSSSGEDLQSFCRSRDLSATTLRAWVAREGVLETVGARPPGKTRQHRYTPEQKRAAVEGFRRSGRTQADFAALWGVSSWTLGAWTKRYEEEGPKGLEPRYKAGPGRPRVIAEEVREEIARTKGRFPDFGLRKVRDWL